MYSWTVYSVQCTLYSVLSTVYNEVLFEFAVHGTVQHTKKIYNKKKINKTTIVKNFLAEEKRNCDKKKFKKIVTKTPKKYENYLQEKKKNM